MLVSAPNIMRPSRPFGYDHTAAAARHYAGASKAVEIMGTYSRVLCRSFDFAAQRGPANLL